MLIKFIELRKISYKKSITFAGILVSSPQHQKEISHYTLIFNIPTPTVK